jgi:16S rRNA G1207 methylase RsmC
MQADIPPYPQEQLLIDAIPRMSADRLICTSAGLAQFAAIAARAMPQATVSSTYLDLYRANLAMDYWKDCPPNLRIECTADLPSDEADVVAFPFSSGGEAELTRDLIQAGHERLRIGGQMYAATENRKDKWLLEQLSKVFRKLECYGSPAGVLYVGTKTEPLKRVRNLACEFAFRDRGQLIRAYSRPGVFSHRHLDTGARRLMDQMELEPGTRVLDIGCGAGTVSLAAACRDKTVTVHAVDSNARAIECTNRGAELNELASVTSELNDDGNYSAGNYDLALANPPYYASFRIAEHFLAAGRRALRPGGKILIVTKSPAWYHENIARWFDQAVIREIKGYYVVEAVRPADR